MEPVEPEIAQGFGMGMTFIAIAWAIVSAYLLFLIQDLYFKFKK